MKKIAALEKERTGPRSDCRRKGIVTLSALSFHPMNSQAIEHDRQAYFRAHPLGAAAVKHPRIVIDHGRYVAILGRSISRGVVGFGTSVASALRAFDHIYLSYLYSQRR